ncbi:MAG: hypothetical protein JNJ81_11200 [Candidatus Accumulibacter sp.]|nr:hypothetical protein [Accumulibacter sp.]
MTAVSPEIRQQVLELRRSHSLREVAARTGLPIGTVKTICSRSGAFRDNAAHRALFCLPPIQPSTQTLPAVPELPQQQRVTGDNEIDAVLWLRSVIDTGQAALIDKALEASKRIKTPLKELEKRYMQHLVSTNPENPMMAAFGSLGFSNLESLARRAMEREGLRTEAANRFGDHIFADTPAEKFCVASLAGLKRKKNEIFLDDTDVDARFQSRPELLPNTLSDCLHELGYWHDLYRLRNASIPDYYDNPQEATARESFAFRCLARIRPRNKGEAVAVFRYLAADRMDRSETNDILLNMIG